MKKPPAVSLASGDQAVRDPAPLDEVNPIQDPTQPSPSPALRSHDEGSDMMARRIRDEARTTALGTMR
ncbi:hypothetical protein CIW48_22395 [Methylobacterium sp. P1-11]|nr:hypothetical protein CIW48_22395 [Methylobacterium sp. P1-11]